MLIKLTDKDMRTYNGYQWVLGEERRTSGEGGLCGPGWLHCYEGSEDGAPLLAVMMNPIHSWFDPSTMRMFEADGDVGLSDGTFKSGCSRMVLTREIPVPCIPVDVRVRFAIYCRQAVNVDAPAEWTRWAENWLSGEDRSRESAASQASSLAAVRAESLAAEREAEWSAVRSAEREAVRAAARAARASAWEAEWSAVWAADAAARAAVWAAEAARWAEVKLDLCAIAVRAVRDELAVANA